MQINQNITHQNEGKPNSIQLTELGNIHADIIDIGNGSCETLP